MRFSAAECLNYIEVWLYVCMHCGKRFTSSNAVCSVCSSCRPHDNLCKELRVNGRESCKYAVGQVAGYQSLSIHIRHIDCQIQCHSATTQDASPLYWCELELISLKLTFVVRCCAQSCRRHSFMLEKLVEICLYRDLRRCRDISGMF